MMFEIKKTGSVTEFVEDFYKSSDKVVLHDKIEGMLVGTLYDMYRAFCIENGMKMLSQRGFVKRIEDEYTLTTERCTVRSEAEGGRIEYRLRFVKRE